MNGIQTLQAVRKQLHSNILASLETAWCLQHPNCLVRPLPSCIIRAAQCNTDTISIPTKTWNDHAHATISLKKTGTHLAELKNFIADIRSDAAYFRIWKLAPTQLLPQEKHLQVRHANSNKEMHRYIDIPYDTFTVILDDQSLSNWSPHKSYA